MLYELCKGKDVLT